MKADSKEDSSNEVLRRAGCGRFGVRLRPELEKRFGDEVLNASRRSFRLLMLVLCVTTAAGFIVNGIVSGVGAILPAVLVVQLVFSAVLIGATFLQWLPRFNEFADLIASIVLVTVGFMIFAMFHFTSLERLMNIVVLTFLSMAAIAAMPFPFGVRAIGLGSLAIAFSVGCWHRGIAENRYFFGLLCMFGSGATIGLLTAFLQDRAQRFAYLLRLELEQERAWSQRLLSSILPDKFSSRLRQQASGEGKAIVERHEEVSILFADLVGFSTLATRRSAETVVDMLNILFSRFDAIADKLGVEKIKTIGDAYLAVSGLSLKGEGHQVQLAEMAIEMRAVMEDYARETGDRLEIRIGIHCGAVVAGVIGTSRFQFDLWGEAVNLASRMESHGIPGEIQVSEAMRAALADQFELIPRGEIPIKGIGHTPAFILSGRKASGLSRNPSLAPDREDAGTSGRSAAA